MATNKSDFIPLNYGVDRSGSWFNRPLGTLYESVNLVPADFLPPLNYTRNAKYNNGSLCGRTRTNFTSADVNPAYFSYKSDYIHNTKEYMIDENKHLYEDSTKLLELGANFVRSSQTPVHLGNGKAYLPIEGYGGTGDSGLVMISSGYASFVPQAPKSLSRISLHDGRIYGISYDSSTVKTADTEKLYFSEGDYTFLSGDGFTTSISPGNDNYNVFSMNNDLFVYHSGGITRILGDPVNGFTYDRMFSFNGGNPGGGLINGLYDYFIFSINYKPYIFNGQVINEIMEGYPYTIYKADSIGSNIAILGMTRPSTSIEDKRVWGWVYFDTRTGRSWEITAAERDPFVETEEGDFQLEASYNWLIDGDSELRLFKDTEYQYYIINKNTSYVTTDDYDDCYLVTNPINFNDVTLPLRLTVVAEIEDDVEMAVYASSSIYTADGMQPTWVTGVLQSSINNRHSYSFPGIIGTSFIFKIAFRNPESGSDSSIRLFGLDDIQGSILNKRIQI
jgi:hypothetical protein